MLLVHAVQCGDWLHAGATTSDSYVDHGGGAGRVDFGDERSGGL